ncbi:site-specific integrase [Alloscardovia macacae]|uniref:Integrase n=1 Tax=Alloscardovia macacae TaxID=1160091 RepID=A0A261F4J3_9BIFI|nr:site-specific integrase [Alloscardovia macacae]OZG54057.1 integrase [Alloscardovia macacae]
MGSVHEYSSSTGKRFYVSYRDENGKQHTKGGFRRKRDAQQWIAETLTAMEAGTFTDPIKSNSTIAALAPQWYEAKKGVSKPTYMRDLESALRVHVLPKWGRRKLNSIKPSHVQAWVSELAQEKSATVVLRAYGCLKGIYEMAMRDGLIKVSPCEHITLPRKMRKQRTYLTPEQVISLANASGEHRTLILVLGFCGLRWGEASALRVEDIDTNKNTISVHRNYVRAGREHVEGAPKTWENRIVPVPRLIMRELAKDIEGKKPSALVFTGWDGGHLHEQSRHNNGWYAKAIRESGVPSLAVHDLRHTAASIAISSGANVKAVQKMLGHKNASMTLDTYADLFDKDMHKVADSINDVIEVSITSL